MRVLVAGASGAIGRPLARELVAAGDEVTGLARTESGAREIRAAGAKPVLCDVFDRAALASALSDAAPEVVVNELTSFSRNYDPRRLEPAYYKATNRLRREGARNLFESARAAGVRRLVTQSIAFLYDADGPMVQGEDDRPAVDAPPPFGETVRIMVEHEREALTLEGVETVVLRYGWLYGPGTWYAADGSVAALVRKRRIPVVPGGVGLFSFVHVSDAVAVTAAACEHGRPGVYNVVDDDPATVEEWLPVYAEALGAKPPRRVPRWLGKLAAGETLRRSDLLRGASNAKAKRELGWAPTYPTWRRGFFEALG